MSRNSPKIVPSTPKMSQVPKKEISKKDREILKQLSTGKTDLEVCRALGLLPSQLEQVIRRATQWVDSHETENSDMFMVERALRKLSENLARSLDSRFAALIDISPEAILVVNALTGLIKQANENAANMFGYALEDLLNRSMEDLVPVKYRGIHPAYRIGFLSSSRKRQMGYHPPIFGVKSDGTEVEIAIAITSATDEDVMVICTEFATWSAFHASETVTAKTG